MQTQSMTVTVTFKDASILDYKPYTVNQLRSWGWSEKKLDLWNVE